MHVTLIILQFADDTEVSGIVDSEDSYKIQQNLDALGKWAEEQLTEFNAGKCKVLHFKKLNQTGPSQ